MEDIINNLKSPSWWFTAFFVAILASVIAGFLKDKIASLIGGISSSLRAWEEKREKKQEEVVDALVNNTSYLNIALFRAIVALILFAISVIIYSTAPVMLSMVPADKDQIISIDRGFFIWKVFYPFLGAFTAYIGYRTTSRLNIVFEAIKKYREEHDLPRIP